MFIAALLTIAKTWKKVNIHRQRNGYRKCGVYIYSVIKKNDMPFAATWMDPEVTTLSQTKRKTNTIRYVESKM